MIDFAVTGDNFMSNNTRSRVLRTLLLNQRRTVNELAESVGINPISVRHHVNKLEAEGLIESQEERHGVGRPRLVYSLTQMGMEQFPQRYLQLTLRLLEQLKSSLPAEVIGDIFREVAQEMAGEITKQVDLQELNLEQRLELLQRALVAEGFMVELEEENGDYYIVEASCPYHHVGEDYPEICIVDEELIARFADTSPKRVECILDGDKQCRYLIKPKAK
jgi:DeoR family suf operon transcriptional repressor